MGDKGRWKIKESDVSLHIADYVANVGRTLITNFVPFKRLKNVKFIKIKKKVYAKFIICAMFKIADCRRSELKGEG
jgi:hypothetical protein